MQFQQPLSSGRLINRYKRFLTDVVPDDPSISDKPITIHCPNTGSMKNCVYPDTKAWFSDSNNPKRKYRYTWEIASNPQGDLIGINTHRANSIIIEALQKGLLPTMYDGQQELLTEVKYGEQNSRIDILINSPDKPLYIEVKSVTLLESGQEQQQEHQSEPDRLTTGYFPDSVSTRATKHLQELQHQLSLGHRAALVYCVQHNGIDSVSPAAHIDLTYAKELKQAVSAGLEIYAIRAHVSPDGIAPTQQLPVNLK
jgi:sugar fermentation stimulation protein A